MAQTEVISSITKKKTQGKKKKSSMTCSLILSQAMQKWIFYFQTITLSSNDIMPLLRNVKLTPYYKYFHF